MLRRLQLELVCRGVRGDICSSRASAGGYLEFFVEMSRRVAVGGLRKTHAGLQLNVFEFWGVSSGSTTQPCEYSSYPDDNAIRIYSILHGKCNVALKLQVVVNKNTPRHTVSPSIEHHITTKLHAYCLLTRNKTLLTHHQTLPSLSCRQKPERQQHNQTPEHN